MADVNRGKKEFLDNSYEVLSPYDGSTGVRKIAWEGRRKNEYRKWLKEVSQESPTWTSWQDSRTNEGVFREDGPETRSRTVTRQSQ